MNYDGYLMTMRLSIALLIGMSLVIIASPALGSALQDVPLGGDVFIGEQGLNLTGIPSGTNLSWYTGPGTVGRSAPAVTVIVGNNTSFYVAPSIFSGFTGNWYIGNTTKVGFVVNNPSLAVMVYDQDTQNDVTNKSVTSGHFLTFRVETNMYVIPAQRPGAAGFLNIRVKSPEGTVYTRLYQDKDTRLRLEDLAANMAPWYWVPLDEGSEEGWSTGFIGPENEKVYPEGRYSFWVESDLNGMKENYNDLSGHDFTGRTVSAVRGITIASDIVKIDASNVSVPRGKPFTVTIYGRPDSIYYLWVKGTSSMSGTAGNQPPSIILSQEGVRMDPKAGPWPIGQYVFQGSTKTIQQDVSQNYGRDNVRGTVYYASVTLPGTGCRTVGFSTTKDTDDLKYTIRVERPEPYDPPASNTGNNRTFQRGEVDVAVKKGDVGDSEGSPELATGTRSYYFGEDVALTGTNSETDFTYLFITGPNLPISGGQMNDPRKAVNPVDPATITWTDVVTETWEYKWVTGRLDLDPGVYTIYASSSPVNMSTLGDSQYSSIAIMLRRPFISARVSQTIVASGDPLFIHGVAAGQPVNGVAVWILGRNKVIYKTTGVNSDGTFEKEIQGWQTAEMVAGQYFVVVQHPMYNEMFDIWPSSSASDFNNNEFVSGSYPVSGNTLFRLQGPGSLQGSDAAEALVQALSNPGIDDMYADLQFLVEVPEITILPVNGKQVGDTFSIMGATNLATDDTILVEVTSSSFGPTTKTRSGEFSGVSGTVTVQKGSDGLNWYIFPVNATVFRPDEYIVHVSGITVNTEASTRFDIVEFNPAMIRTTPTLKVNDEVPEDQMANSSLSDIVAGDEDVADSSKGISIEAKVSTLAKDYKSITPLATMSPLTKPPVTLETIREDSAGRAVPTTRPTSQQGFDVTVALAGLGVLVIGLKGKS